MATRPENAFAPAHQVSLDELVDAPPTGDPRVQLRPFQRWGLHLVLGEHDVILTPGEVAEFDTHIPHWFGNPGPEPAELLGLFGPQEERLHIRARPTGR